MKTKQEIFDTVVAHLRKQGTPALRANRCAYRTPEGLKCAVGCLIPDELYSPRIENTAALNLHLIDPKLGKWMRQEFEEDSFSLLERLQVTHDKKLQCNWESEFQQIAREFGLKYSPK